MILTVNPGSTSTKINIFSSQLQQVVADTLYDPEDFASQLAYIKKLLVTHNITNLDCIVARGGLVKPVAAGSYLINQAMLDDLTNHRYGKHASNLGALLAYELGNEYHCPAFITDPVCVDELNPLARYTGLPTIKRNAISHALNIRATARLVANQQDQALEETNFVVAHIGGGCSIVALAQGHIIDTTNALDGGPFTPQRAGTIPMRELVALAFSGKYKTANDLIHELLRNSGLLAHLGTADGSIIFKRITAGDKQAEEVVRAMGYQIAKEIGAMASVLSGLVQAIILTGGLARPPLTDWIKEWVAWIAPVICHPGEHEQEALAAAGARFLSGAETLKTY